MARTFKIDESNISVSGGRYVSDSPYAAAMKAASKLFLKAKDKKENKKKIIFSLRETTRGSNKEVFKYEATQVKYDKPIIRNINGVEIVYKFKTNVKAI